METRTGERQPHPVRSGPVPALRVLFTGARLGEGHGVTVSGDVEIGRQPERGLALPDDPMASRRHARVTVRGAQAWIEDLQSRHGTTVDRRPVTGRTPLHDGAVIRVGDSFLLYRLMPRPRDGEPVVPELVGSAPAIGELRRTLAQVAASGATVVLIGESGSGKGQSARALHRLSGRRGPFVQVNCAAIPEALAESALFGHRQGAFTGAVRAEPGYFRSAHGGTLFVDEIGDLPAALQPKLLHAIEERRVVSVGDTRPEPVDVRVVTATSADLRRAVADGRFRGDLWARIAEIVVRLPPLRERLEDVLPLLVGFLGPAAPLAPDLVERLLAWHWPWNVRELRNVATELSVRGAGLERLEASLIEGRFEDPLVAPAPPEARDPSPAAGPPDRAVLEAALRDHGGVVTDAARALGRSRRQVYRWIGQLGIDLDTVRGGDEPG